MDLASLTTCQASLAMPPLGGSFSIPKVAGDWVVTTSFTKAPLVTGGGTSTCKEREVGRNNWQDSKKKKKKNIYIYIYI